jgi:hypothetical protein
MKRKYFERNEWRQRVSPVLIGYWSSKNKLDRTDSREKQKWKTAFDEMAEASRSLHLEQSKVQGSISMRVWPEIIKPLDGEKWSVDDPRRAYAVNPEASAFFRDIVFLKYGLTFRELVLLSESDPEAHRKLIRVHYDFYRFRWGRGSNDLKLKFNLLHFSLIVQGLDFGLEKLNEIELASCFDEICPCAQTHSGEYLKKLRVRVRRTCQDLISRMEHFTTSVEYPRK